MFQGAGRFCAHARRGRRGKLLATCLDLLRPPGEGGASSASPCHWSEWSALTGRNISAVGRSSPLARHPHPHTHLCSSRPQGSHSTPSVRVTKVLSQGPRCLGLKQTLNLVGDHQLCFCTFELCRRFMLYSVAYP